MTRVLQINTPGGAKPGLLKHPRRTRRLIHWANVNGVGLIGLEELSTPSRIVWRAAPRWRLVCASPNNVRVWALGRIGNGVALRRGVWSVQGKAEVRLPWGTRGLRIPKVHVRHEVLGDVLVYAIHLPAGPAHDARRAAMIRTLAADAETQTLPVIWLGDFNDDDVPALLRARDADWEVAGRHVDWVATLGVTIEWAEVLRVFQGSVSDHPGVLAEIRPTH